MFGTVFKSLLLLLPPDYDERDRQEMWDTFERRTDPRKRMNGHRPTTFDQVGEVLDLARLVLRSRLGSKWTNSFNRDIRFAVRSLTRRPLFALVAVGTLGLGIGATTSIFSVVEGVLLRPLPYHRPEQLVTVWQTFPEWRDHETLAAQWDRVVLSQPGFSRLQAGQTSFDAVGAFRLTSGTIVGAGEPVSVSVGVSSASLFSVLGVEPTLGRGFLLDEDGAGADAVAILSGELWADRFGMRPDILGSSVTLGSTSYTVVGVLPRGFKVRRASGTAGEWEGGIWLSMGLDAAAFREDNHWYEAIARLKTGVSPGRASEEVKALLRMAGTENDPGVRIQSRASSETGEFREPLFALLGAVTVLLLVACANVAALHVGELAGRSQEIATRKALGASNTRIFQQLLTESLLIGVTGSAVGILISLAGVRALLSFAPPIPRLDEVGINGSILIFSLGTGVITGLVFGLAPAFAAFRERVCGVLGEGSSIGGGRGSTVHSLVVSGEIALTAVLLVTGGLLCRTFFNLLEVETGFRQERLSELRVSVPTFRVPAEADRRATYREMIEAVASLPGVSSVSATASFPFSGQMLADGIMVEGQITEGSVPRHIAQRRIVSPGFFRTMGIPLLSGRVLSDEDGPDAARVAVISQSMAERLWPGRDPLGERFISGDTMRVVGIVGDVRHESLRADIHPTFYRPTAQTRLTTLSLVIRTDADPEPLFPRLREAVERVDPQARIIRLSSAYSAMLQTAKDDHFRAVLFATFAVVATLLAGSGIFGVTARRVELRRKEMAIRLALGATDSVLKSAAVLRSISSAAVGVGVGLTLTLANSRLISGFLFEIGGADPLTYVGTAFCLVVVSLLASSVSARRISHMEPMGLLKEG